MKTAKLRVQPWKWGGPGSRWVVEGLRDASGKRTRRFFPSRDDANHWLRSRRGEMRSQGRASLGLSERQRVDATDALAILQPLGATLTQAATEFAEKAKALARTVTFRELREELVATKEADRKSPAYLHDLRHRLSRFGETFDERPVAVIESREIDDWLRALSLSASSRHNYRKVLRTAFAFSVSRGYSRNNPVVQTAEVKVVLNTPGILRPNEIAALLRHADRKIVASIAIGAFAGLRDAEIGKLTWLHVDMASGYIKLDAKITKMGSRRTVPIAPNLAAWLAPLVEREGPVRPSFRTYYRAVRLARKAAASDLRQQSLPCDGVSSWPRNALRHSYASYRYAVVGDPVRVAEECGHSVQVLKSHYKELVTTPEGQRWFSVLPPADYANVVAFKTA